MPGQVPGPSPQLADCHESLVKLSASGRVRCQDYRRRVCRGRRSPPSRLSRAPAGARDSAAAATGPGSANLSPSITVLPAEFYSDPARKGALEGLWVSIAAQS
jgi:hypothetical protein